MFQFFGMPMLFRVQSLVPLFSAVTILLHSCLNNCFQGSEKGRVLNTFVVAASVTNASTPIQNLDDQVKVTLYHLTPNTVGPAVCFKHNLKPLKTLK